MFVNGLLTIDEDRPEFWKSYLLGTLVHLTSRGQQSHIEEWGQLAGATSVFFQPAVDPLLSGVAFVRDLAEGVIAFQGTRSAGQVLREVLFSPQATFTGVPGTVHGFFGANFFDRLNALEPNFAGLAANFPVTFTGHSLGGALAHIGYHYFQPSGPIQSKALVTFGQPRTGNPTFARATPKPYVRWNNVNDVVPALPPNEFFTWALIGPLATRTSGLNYMHPRKGHRLDDAPPTFRRGDTFIRDEWGPLGENPLLRLRACHVHCIDKHVMTTYLDTLYALAQQQGSPIPLALFRDLNDEMDDEQED